MTNDTIAVPLIKVVEGRTFYADRTDRALQACRDAGYEPLFMPEVIDARVYSPKGSPIFQTWYSTPSIRATGKTKQGNAVVVYAHIPNCFSNPKNITNAIEQHSLRNGAAPLPHDEFQRLLDLEDNERVFVIEYDKLRNSSSGVISVEKFLAHPQTIPFIGGEERAEAYKAKHEEVYGKEIGVWHSDDLVEGIFLARPLCVGLNDDDGLNGYCHFDLSGQVLGVQRSAGEASAPRNFPSQDGLAAIINEFVAPVNQEEVWQRVKNLYE